MTREEPLFTLDQISEHLGADPDELAAFIDREMPAMVAEGAAHWDDDRQAYIITGLPDTKP